MVRVAVTVVLIVASVLNLAESQSANNNNNNNSKPQLLTFEQQQDLLAQLAALQRQTQQLLAAQQSLAAVAAAAAANNPQAASADISRVVAPTQTHQQSSSPLRTLPKPQRPTTSTLPPVSSTAATVKPVIVEEANNGNNSQLPAGPQINWGKCPELEPTETEKMAKASVITKCLESTPLPTNITRESVEAHREQIAACALRAEGWFTGAGGYDFGKAEKEIKNKHLSRDLESQVLSYHAQCKTESEEKYPASSASIIAQIQLYQACMDYFISDVCGIEVSEPEQGQPGPGQFQ